jgi:hypothetical protein
MSINAVDISKRIEYKTYQRVMILRYRDNL